MVMVVAAAAGGGASHRRRSSSLSACQARHNITSMSAGSESTFGRGAADLDGRNQASHPDVHRLIRIRELQTCIHFPVADPTKAVKVNTARQRGSIPR